MPQIIEQGDVFGRIGKAFGEGAAAQAERGAGANALRNLSISKETNPIKQLANLYGAPGVTPEMARNVLPYLQNSAIANEAASAFSPNGSNISQQNISPTSQQNDQIPSQNSQQQANRPVPLRLKSTPADIRAGGQRYLKQTPLRYGNDLLKAEAQYQQDVKNQNDQIAEVGAHFDTAAKQLLQKDPNGEVFNKFKEQAENSVLSGDKTGSEAGREFSRKMLDFDKSRAKQETQGTSWFRNLFSKAPRKQLDAARKAYQDAGLPEVFRDDLVTFQKLSKQGASEIAFPLRNEDIEFFKKIKPFGKITGGDEKVYQQAADRIKEDDSILNFALQLYKKGYDPQKFMDIVAASEKPLTPRQNREFQERGDFTPSIGDILYSSFGNPPGKLAYF